MFKTNNYNIVDFEILSYNLRGVGNERKRKKLFNYIKKHTSSNTIVCLLETHSTKKDVLLWKYQWHCTHFCRIKGCGGGGGPPTNNFRKT